MFRDFQLLAPVNSIERLSEINEGDYRRQVVGFEGYVLKLFFQL